MNNKYQELIGKELSRKDFLKLIGGGVIALLGVSNFVNYLLHFQHDAAPKVTVDAQHGFGSRKFGG